IAVDAAPIPDLSNVAPAERAPDKVEQRVRVTAKAIHSMLWTAGEIAISTSQVQERMKHALSVLAELRERQQAVRDHSNDMKNFVTTQGIAAGRRQVRATEDAARASTFDPLEMDQYNELHTHVQTI